MDNIRIISHDRNCGKGASIRTALSHARGEYVLIQDSDLEYDPQDYPALLAPLEKGKANVVYGVRPDRPERGLRFFLGAKLLTHLTNFLSGTDIHDEATCYKVFRRSVLTRIELKCRRFEFCPEVTAKLCRMDEKIAEVPISYHPRSAVEGKKIRHADGWPSGLCSAIDLRRAVAGYRAMSKGYKVRSPSVYKSVDDLWQCPRDSGMREYGYVVSGESHADQCPSGG